MDARRQRVPHCFRSGDASRTACNHPPSPSILPIVYSSVALVRVPLSFWSSVLVSFK